MNRAVYLSALLFSMLVIYCGTDYTEEGKKAYNNGNYSDAIKYFTMAKKADSTIHEYDEMLSSSYFRRGQELYKTTRNLKAFSANFLEGKKLLPANPSQEFTRQYVKVYVELASAYAMAKGKNEEEKDNNFDQALSAVKEAIAIDSTYAPAESLLVSLKEEHFQGLIDKAKELYNKAGRTRNYDLYFSAEYYLKEAEKFEKNNPQIKNLLQQITRQTLPVLNYREDISMAVAGITRERKALVMNVSIKNYSDKAVNLLVSNFTLVDTDGNNYYINEQEMKKRELFGETCIADTILNGAHPMETGLLAFNAPKEIEIDYIAYQLNGSKSVRKYFR